VLPHGDLPRRARDDRADDGARHVGSPLGRDGDE
jgi:hypothetical protein